jgi:hypothetical protein
MQRFEMTIAFFYSCHDRWNGLRGAMLWRGCQSEPGKLKGFLGDRVSGKTLTKSSTHNRINL